MSNPLHMALEIAQWRTVPVYDGLYRGDHIDERDELDDDFICLFNRVHPGWSLSELCDLLLELQSRGFIYFFRDRYNVPSIKTIKTAMNRDTLTTALKLPGKELHLLDPESNNLYYALTPEGGACWEDAAQADWNRYLNETSGYSQTWRSVFGDINRDWDAWDDDPVEPGADVEALDTSDWTNDSEMDPEQILLSSMNRDLMEDSFATDADLFKIVVPGSRQDGEVRPWHPFYWKTLPFAYRLGYTIYSANTRLMMDSPYKTDEDRAALNLDTPNWYRSVFPPYEPSN